MRRLSDTVLVICTLGLIVALVSACSGRQSGGSTQVDPEKIGEEGSYDEETQANFIDAYKTYEQAAQGGLDEGECDNVADTFEEIHENSAAGVPEALFNAGLVWDKCGDQEKATDFFEQANKIAKAREVALAKAEGQPTSDVAPGFAPAFIQLGAYAYKSGNKGQAKRLFDQARESDRRSTEAYTNLGILQREDEQWSDAQLNFRRALAVNSDFMTAFAQMALLYLEVAEENRQMYDIVELVSQQATGRAAEIKSNPLDIAPIFNIWGLSLIRQGDVVRAVEKFNKARTLDPEFFEAHMNYGAVNLSFRGFAEAEKAFRSAVKLRPDSYQAHLSLGAALRGLDRFDDARASYEKARQIDSSAPGAYYNLAVLTQDYELSSAGDMDAQIALLGKAKQVYQEFIQKCRSRSEDCVRKRIDEPAQDMREIAQKRIKACEETMAGLREAKQLAAEAAAIEAEMQQDMQAAEGGGGQGEASGEEGTTEEDGGE